MCNAYNHGDDCPCGFGGATRSGAYATYPPALRTRWQYHDEDFCRPTTCPCCGADVYFVRHNGGSVWFDELGPPWDKHGCFAEEQGGRTLRAALRGRAPEGRSRVFGVVIESVRENGQEQLTIRCSTGRLIQTRQALDVLRLGQLVLVELEDELLVGVTAVRATAKS